MISVEMVMCRIMTCGTASGKHHQSEGKIHCTSLLLSYRKKTLHSLNSESSHAQDAQGYAVKTCTQHMQAGLETLVRSTIV